MFCILPRENRGNHHAFRQRFFQAVAAFGRTANRGQKSPVRPRSRSRRPGGNPRPSHPDSAPRIFGNRRTARADRASRHGSPDRANFAADSVFIFGNCGQTGSDRFGGNARANGSDITARIFGSCRTTCSDGNARSDFVFGNCRQTCSDCFGGNSRSDGSDIATRIFGSCRTTCSDRNARSDSACFGNSRANGSALAAADSSTDFGNNRPVGSGGFGSGNSRARFVAG